MCVHFWCQSTHHGPVACRTTFSRNNLSVSYVTVEEFRPALHYSVASVHSDLWLFVYMKLSAELWLTLLRRGIHGQLLDGAEAMTPLPPCWTAGMRCLCWYGVWFIMLCIMAKYLYLSLICPKDIVLECSILHCNMQDEFAGAHSWEDWQLS